MASILGTEVLGDDDQRKSPMVMIRLPLTLTADDIQRGKEHLLREQIEREISEKHGTWIPLIYHGRHLYTRLSGQVYLTLNDFEKAGHILSKVCKAQHNSKL